MNMHAIRIGALAVLGVAVLASASDPRGVAAQPAIDGVPNSLPGRDLPAVRQYSYRMAGRIRVLLLWVGRDDVGSAVFKWKRDGDNHAIELLIGTDPRRAPSQMNKWGYFVEETRGGRTSVVGLISQEDDDRLSDVKADLKKRKDMRAFDTVRGGVGEQSAVARVGTLYAPSQLTYRDASAVLTPVLADTSLPVKRLDRRNGVRAGFLSALVELIDGTVKGREVPGRRLSYIHGDRMFELRLQDSTKLPRFERDGRTFERVIRSRFDTREAGARAGTKFEIVYGSDGELAGVPILVSYQPKWWLQVDLVLHS